MVEERGTTYFIVSQWFIRTHQDGKQTPSPAMQITTSTSATTKVEGFSERRIVLPEKQEVPRKSFGDTLQTFAKDVNTLQLKAGRAADLLATGGVSDVHQVMVAVEEASIALDLMLEIRNRVVEAYQEVMRMQV